MVKYGCRRTPYSCQISTKTSEMNVSARDVFKKSKIIEIGSVKKKLRLREVGGFWKKSGNPGIFVSEIWDFGSETVHDSKNF